MYMGELERILMLKPYGEETRSRAANGDYKIQLCAIRSWSDEGKKVKRRKQALYIRK